MAERRITGRVNNPGDRRGLAFPDFTSAEQTVAINTLLTVAHSLGQIPNLTQLVLRCTTGDLGYNANDEAVVNAAQGATVDQGYTLIVDATNFLLEQSAAIIIIARSSTIHDTEAITTTSWRWVIRAWK